MMARQRMLEVIEISSSESEGEDPVSRLKATSSKNSSNSGIRTQSARYMKTPKKNGRSQRVVYSSSGESDHDVRPAAPRRVAPGPMDVIEITSSSETSDNENWRSGTGNSRKESKAVGLRENVDDGILVLNEPRSARKPVKKAGLSRTVPSPSQAPKTPGKVRIASQLEIPNEPLRLSRENTLSLSLPAHVLSSSKILEPPRTPKRNPASSTPAKTPRTSKKAAVLAAQAQREAYAQDLFDELNRTVFDGGLPAGTKLVWSNRLLTTAGRARWHRSKEGVHTTEIELATKILDCNERIRNTLSHEMCHLACWIINKEPKEAHGRFFKSWAAKVMRKRPEIEITTRHDYEISYRYEWKCEKCSKVYGRHSKSIRTEEVVCGACRIGKLIPLFAVRTKVGSAPKTPVAKQAAGTACDSPRFIADPVPLVFDEEDAILARIVGGLRLG